MGGIYKLHNSTFLKILLVVRHVFFCVFEFVIFGDGRFFCSPIFNIISQRCTCCIYKWNFNICIWCSLNMNRSIGDERTCSHFFVSLSLGEIQLFISTSSNFPINKVLAPLLLGARFMVRESIKFLILSLSIKKKIRIKISYILPTGSPDFFFSFSSCFNSSGVNSMEKVGTVPSTSGVLEPLFDFLRGK